MEIVKRSIEGSLCFGIYNENKQIGFARMITDKATFAYLADVFIIDEYRNKGAASVLIKYIMSHKDLQGLRRILLATKDAHGLYKKHGFSMLTNTDRWMQIHNPDVYNS